VAGRSHNRSILRRWRRPPHTAGPCPRRPRLRDARPRIWPEILAIATVFTGSRAVAWALGLRFDANSLSWFWQYIDPALLKTRLLESLFYFHAQPPLYNLWLGVLLKLFGGQFRDASHGTYVLVGLVGTGALALFLAKLGVPRLLAVVLALAFFLSPTAILYENWLFYEYPVAVLLIFAVLTLYLFLERRSFAYGVAFFRDPIVDRLYPKHLPNRLAVAGVGTRSRRPARFAPNGAARMRGSATPRRPSVCQKPDRLRNAFHEFVVWDEPSEVVLYSVPEADRAQLVADGRISRVSLVVPFSSVAAYRGIVPPARKRGIRVLDEQVKSTGQIN
jgi:hypothetical protein